MDDPGIFCLRDVWLGLQQNQPRELRDIRVKYISEVKQDVIEKWTNREKVVMNLRVLKDWHVKDWNTRTEESLYKHWRKYFDEKGFTSRAERVFSQLLSSKVSGFHLEFEDSYGFTYFYRI